MSEERVALLTGDRLCIRCGFNLVGQPVVRERHYGMLMVRCPECGEPASLQEYPWLGKWAGRWAALLAAGWFVGVLLFLVVNVGAVYLFARTATHWAARPLAMTIAEDAHAWQTRMLEELRESEDPSATTQKYALLGQLLRMEQQQAQWQLQSPGVIVNYWIDGVWWQEQDGRAFVRRSGGAAAAIGAVPVSVWVWMVIVGAVLGTSWAVALLHRSRRALLALGLVPIVVAGAAMIVWPPKPGVTAWWGGGTMPAQVVAEPLVWLPTALAVSVVMWGSMALGLVFGRPGVRLAAGVLMPPRQCQALSLLWTCDGMEPPVAGGLVERRSPRELDGAVPRENE